MRRGVRPRRSLVASLAAVPLVLVACSKSSEEPKGNPVAENCGFVGSPGNELGVGKYCTDSSACPAVHSGTALQCSSVLVQPTFPLICSRLCDPQAADPGCGSNSVCKNLTELGLDLTVCVPVSCQPLFAEPLQ